MHNAAIAQEGDLCPRCAKAIAGMDLSAL
ncbi:MAG: hypothetical protein LIO51_06925 [Clostridiales bacterium]|nr:hypothetical protein [Clostridiales bacterium]